MEHLFGNVLGQLDEIRVTPKKEKGLFADVDNEINNQVLRLQQLQNHYQMVWEDQPISSDAFKDIQDISRAINLLLNLKTKD
tara:strand:+ start:450 stop:695 length:246 start_codon:yes stop_codon:yes gene_type:complete